MLSCVFMRCAVMSCAALCCAVLRRAAMCCDGLSCAVLRCVVFSVLCCAVVQYCCSSSCCYLLVAGNVAMTPARCIRPARGSIVFVYFYFNLCIASLGDVNCGALRDAEPCQEPVLSFLRWTIPTNHCCGAGLL